MVLLQALDVLLRRVLSLSAPGRLLQVPRTVYDLADVPGERWSGCSLAIAWQGVLAGLTKTYPDLLEGAPQ